MISHAEKNYFLNIPLTIIGFACLISGLLLGDKSVSFGGLNLKSLHIWTGYIMTGLIGLHLLMHIKWIQNITTGIFKNRLKVVSLVTTILISLGICYASGILGQNGKGQGYPLKGQNQSINSSIQDQPDSTITQ
ncbi:MAG: DUF4405 domain-containing protein [Desulfosporosinus sp.]|nr:DUF4405 domain-containing protein [Desulfosporosinus sp.]